MRPLRASGTWPDWMESWETPFAETIDRARKHVVSSTLADVDWNAELVRGDLGQAVQRLKASNRSSRCAGQWGRRSSTSRDPMWQSAERTGTGEPAGRP